MDSNNRNSPETFQSLISSTSSSCPLFTLYNTRTVCKIVDIYDGDTVDAIIAYNNQLYHFKARLYGYDSPEMKPSKTDPDRETKKQKALLAKRRLWNLATGLDGGDFTGAHEVILPVVCGEFDKYGRILVNLFPRGANIETYDIQSIDTWFPQTINHQMVAEGHGYPYFGGTKQK